MAALYGRMQGNRGEVTRMGSANSGIESRLETWDGSIKTELTADGNYKVYIGDKHSPSILIATGNVDYASFSAIKDGEPTPIRPIVT